MSATVNIDSLPWNRHLCKKCTENEKGAKAKCMGREKQCTEKPDFVEQPWGREERRGMNRISIESTVESWEMEGEIKILSLEAVSDVK